MKFLKTTVLAFLLMTTALNTRTAGDDITQLMQNIENKMNSLERSFDLNMKSFDKDIFLSNLKLAVCFGVAGILMVTSYISKSGQTMPLEG